MITIMFFPHYRKLVKPTIERDGVRWLKSINDNLKTKLNNFWKHVSKFKKNDHLVTQIKISEVTFLMSV
jgi:hypothetical protein